MLSVSSKAIAACIYEASRGGKSLKEKSGVREGTAIQQYPISIIKANIQVY